MAEIQTRDTGHQSVGVRKSKKLSTRVDLTPMVDLGFLLITFFIFTASMAKSRVMILNVPKDSNIPTLVPKSGALTILPVSDKVYYYMGEFKSNLQSCSYKDIRNIIINKKKTTPADKFYVIIKPSKDANYKNIVDLMDEMSINDVARFSLTDEPANEVDDKM